MNTKITVGVLAAVAIVLGFLAFKNPTVVQVPTTIKFDASSLGNQKAPVVNVPAPVVRVAAPNVSVNVPQQKTLGAVSGPDLYSPYWNVNGVRHEYRSSRLVASTTPCALLAPSATSTLRQASVIVTSATSTATVWTVAKATTGFATTTAFDQFSLGSGAQGSMFVGAASSTAPDEISVIAPNSFIVWGVQGTAIADSTKLNGRCQAEFIVL